MACMAACPRRSCFSWPAARRLTSCGSEALAVLTPVLPGCFLMCCHCYWLFRARVRVCDVPRGRWVVGAAGLCALPDRIILCAAGGRGRRQRVAHHSALAPRHLLDPAAFGSGFAAPRAILTPRRFSACSTYALVAESRATLYDASSACGVGVPLRTLQANGAAPSHAMRRCSA